MTKNERIEIVRLKSKLSSIKYELEWGTKDYDCSWTIPILKEVEEAINVLSKLKC